MEFIEKIKNKAKLLKRETTALYFATRDSRTPWYARAFSALVVAYFLSPIDLVPDFIPVLGFLDDLILVPLGIKLAIKMIPAEVMAEARKEAEKPAADKTASILITIIIVCCWAFIIYLIVSSLLRLLKSSQ
jgi:uncharacterized membrane protein YkvA (DUF1232 family)